MRNIEIYWLENLSLNYDDFFFQVLIKLQNFHHLFKGSTIFIQEFMGYKETGMYSHVLCLQYPNALVPM